jgi:hypothetical protein
MELIQMLTSQLGITDEQASGGAGLIFKMAKEKLGGDDFGKVSSAIPDIEKLISSAPDSGGIAGALGGLASSFGGGAEQLGSLASLAGGFKKLNIDSGLISKFLPIVLSFVQSKGGDSLKGLLEKVV